MVDIASSKTRYLCSSFTCFHYDFWKYFTSLNHLCFKEKEKRWKNVLKPKKEKRIYPLCSYKLKTKIRLTKLFCKIEFADIFSRFV